MDEKFQDRIDNYLLNRMNDTEKSIFLQEVEQDKEKKVQLEFTRNVKDSIRSREEKLRALDLFQKQYEEERKGMALRPTISERSACYCSASETATKPMQPKNRIWLWISGVAAVLVVGFFAINPMFVYESSPNSNNPMEQIRGGEDVFCPNPTDSVDKDSIKFNINKIMTPDE